MGYSVRSPREGSADDNCRRDADTQGAHCYGTRSSPELKHPRLVVSILLTPRHIWAQVLALETEYFFDPFKLMDGNPTFAKPLANR